jgi:Glycosyltransferases involved in cell wall biogenesis
MAVRVSVCLPVYNGAKFLDNAIESICTQSFSDFELIISDDTSQDNSSEIIESWCRKDKRVKYSRNETNQGLYENHNKCMSLAQGEYIKLFAQDDLLHHDCIAKQVEILDNNPSVVLTSAVRVLIDANGESIKNQRAPSPGQVFPTDRVVEGAAVIQACLAPLTNYIGEPSTVMLRKSAVGSGFDSEFRQLGDIAFWLKLMTAGDYYALSGSHCFIRCHEESLSTSNVSGMWINLDTIRFARKYQKMFADTGLSNDEFKADSVELMAHFTAKMMSSNILSETKLEESKDLLARLERLNSCQNPHELQKHCKALIDDVRDFRILAFHSLLTASQHLQRDEYSDEVVQNERVIIALEKELKLLLQSPSWRVTKLLRDFNRIRTGRSQEITMLAPPSVSEKSAASHGSAGVAGGQNNSVEAKSTASAKSATMVATKNIAPNSETDTRRQEEYINQLKAQIVMVKSSRSWKATKVLRQLGKAIST